MAKYECSKCKKMVKHQSLRNKGTKKDPKWICLECLHPKPLVVDVNKEAETKLIEHFIQNEEVKDEGPLPLDGDGK